MLYPCMSIVALFLPYFRNIGIQYINLSLIQYVQISLKKGTLIQK